MASDGPQIQLRAPTFRPEDEDVEAAFGLPDTISKPRSRDSPHLRERKTKNLRLRESSIHRSGLDRDVYLGSYAQSRTTTPRGSIDGRAFRKRPLPSPRASTSHMQLDHLLQAVDTDLETYGVEELRDGFFDAAFYRPVQRKRSDLMRKASLTLPASFKKHHPLSFQYFIPQQLGEAWSFFRQMTTSRAGIRLFKSFLGFFACYIICLIPASRDWLGRYNYILVLSALVNHPGRTVGSQIDGAVMTVFGTIAGLGWGSLALYVSTSTDVARSGYGGVLAAFLVLFTATIGWLRCVFIRFYQAVISAGIAITYTCLADTSETVSWRKLFDFGIPWVLGQVVCLIVAFVVFPAAGSRALCLALNNSLDVIERGLVLPRQDSPPLKRELSEQFVDLSQAVRDFTIEFTISCFRPDDVREMRNLLQSIMRGILSISPETSLFENSEELNLSISQERAINLLREHLSQPSRHLIIAMIRGICCANFVITNDIAKHAFFQTSKTNQALAKALDALITAKSDFDAADGMLINHPDLPSTYANHPEIIEIFLFIHPVRQTADKIEAFVAKVVEMQQTNTKWRIRAPSYPWHKACMRTNPQVRHDRGGLTAGFYFRSKKQLDRTMDDLQSRAYVPAIRHGDASKKPPPEMSVIGDNTINEDGSKASTFRYNLWAVLHRLQGFESRFALKVTMVTVLLSLPAWLQQSSGWWNANESWWTVVTVWSMMHPRVGGTLQDLFVRCFCIVLGSTWASLAYLAGNGNPYIMGVFAAIFMIPMLHRYTQSSHPRSGTVGCISFCIISLDIYTNSGHPSIVTIAWTRGLAFIVGVVAALVTNWILWPFIARHELRKSLSAMLLHQAILYRGVVAKYIYFARGQEPRAEDIARSEMLEGRLREGFVRMRQLMELTRHEMRLRAPFNALPYSALLSASEAFFSHLVQVRQSSLYFQPSMLASSPSAINALATVRRNAVAVILLNLYTLACALRADRPVPRYLPSAAAARRRLLDRMGEVEVEAGSEVSGVSGIGGQGAGDGERGDGHGDGGGDGVGDDNGDAKGSRKRRWADVYQYAYSKALTDIVEELQEMQRFTKEICGEVEWD